jgi:hypothetical protein
VRKVSAIFFLSVMLLSQTPLQQVLRLPVLAIHYTEHKAENNHISFAAFMVLHYFSGHTKDKDYDRDMQLPFRSKEVVLINSTVVVPELVVADFTPPAYQEKPFCPFYSASLRSFPLPDIWQPPRFC